MPSITADSNVWVSAFNFRGKPRQLIERGAEGELHIDISDDIVEEVLRVLRLKFQWSGEALAGARAEMNAIGHKVVPRESVDAVKEDPADNRILECAQAGRSDYIVTGDKDLLRLRVFRDIAIVKIADFLVMAEGRRR
ncbi:MAG TPA: putative toxin-antitoxin system toxin component, PIN family [Terriglobia bacterium]|nr:putative toxin-antitoxin system toxin component, PIN family [Terriglobia bacterium]